MIATKTPSSSNIIDHQNNESFTFPFNVMITPSSSTISISPA
ncbi:hypothetical protein AO368_1670 [Moraxella catarrhalis]|nr:hypothetical protein AO368_1670 [Moraxella catarrhalis]